MAVSVPRKALERRVLDVHGAKSNTAGQSNSPALTVYALVDLGYYLGKVCAVSEKDNSIRKYLGIENSGGVF